MFSKFFILCIIVGTFAFVEGQVFRPGPARPIPRRPTFNPGFPTTHRFRRDLENVLQTDDEASRSRREANPQFGPPHRRVIKWKPIPTYRFRRDVEAELKPEELERFPRHTRPRLPFPPAFNPHARDPRVRF